MKNYDFDWQINEFMIYCRSTQLRERTMYSYEQTLRLFERWCADELKIYSVDKVTENVIRKYINDLQERGKYTFYVTIFPRKRTIQTAAAIIENQSVSQPSITTSATFASFSTGCIIDFSYLREAEKPPRAVWNVSEQSSGPIDFLLLFYLQVVI